VHALARRRRPRKQLVPARKAARVAIDDQRELDRIRRLEAPIRIASASAALPSERSSRNVGVVVSRSVRATCQRIASVVARARHRAAFATCAPRVRRRESSGSTRRSKSCRQDRKASTHALTAVAVAADSPTRELAAPAIVAERVIGVSCQRDPRLPVAHDAREHVVAVGEAVRLDLDTIARRCASPQSGRRRPAA
jgi:hypothetical protein